MVRFNGDDYDYPEIIYFWRNKNYELMMSEKLEDVPKGEMVTYKFISITNWYERE